MGRKSKLTLEKKIEMIEYAIKYGRSRASLEYGYKPHSITRLIKKYKIHGIDGLKTSSTNRIYSIELKKEILSKYLEGESIENLIIKYNTSSTVVNNIISCYTNGKEIKAYEPKSEVYNMKYRKVDKKTKLMIINECLDNNKDYGLIAQKYFLSYSQVYSWVNTYLKKNNINYLNKKNNEIDKDLVIEALQKQLKYKEMELEILKKKDQILSTILGKFWVK